MSVRVAINGFGRVGRSAFRAARTRRGDRVRRDQRLADVAKLAHLLKRDSVYGPFPAAVEAGGRLHPRRRPRRSPSLLETESGEAAVG